MPTKTTPPRNSKPANPKPFFVLHHGAKSTITGSCHEVKLGNTAILIDCGQFQGDDANGKNPLAIDFPVKHIKALIVTHAHIDHIGRIPWLLAAGFKGKIYATPATCELIPLMLEDGLKIQGINKHLRDSVIAQIKRQLHPLKFNQWHRIQISTSKPETLNSKQCLVPFIHTRLQPAGHILGSAYVELKLPNKEVIVFSGDLGPNNTPLLTDPKPPARADYLFIETTYGDKAHESVESRGKRLKNIINRSIKDGGAIIIPAFSVGRTQELLFDIEQLIHEQGISGKIPIILDSPLASKVTRAYRRFRKIWKNEAKAKTEYGRQPLAFDQCIVVESYKQHLSIVNRLATTGEAAIVVAASGMCNGGRVVGYLEKLIEDPRTDILFAGYQAAGTLGNKIQSRSKLIEISENKLHLNAQVHTLSGYSAHADKEDLLHFIKNISTPPKEIHLVHGELATKRAFFQTLSKNTTSRIKI